jgi:hypothetical protein
MKRSGRGSAPPAQGDADSESLYRSFIEQLVPGRAGCLLASPNDSLDGMAEKLLAAAERAGEQMVVRTAGRSVFFWIE